MGETKQQRNPHGDGHYIAALDGWRGIAIILVLLFHGFSFSTLGTNSILLDLGALFGRLGALGVLIFFSISGYLITSRLLVESKSHGYVISLRRFFWKRAFRILPPLAVYLTVIILCEFAGFVQLLPRDATALIFLINYFPGSWYTAHFWSLSVEEHFYLFWPICILFCGWKRAMWIGVGIIAAVAVWRPLALRFLVDGSHPLTTHARLLQHTDMRVDYILMGAVLALGLHFYSSLKPVVAKLGSRTGVLFSLTVLGLATIPAPIDLRTIQAMAITSLVGGSAVAEAAGMKSLLANPILVSLGKISYSVYIWQELFLGSAGGSMWRSIAFLPVKLAIVFAVAWLSFTCIEKPFIHMGRQFLSGHKVKHGK